MSNALKPSRGTIPRSFIDTLLNRADIVQVIQQRVPLKKAGSNYKACCPFHSEKTPSFNVSPQKQFYHCFGCGASGDALKFIMAYDSLPFVEAVEQLAGMYGMEVPFEKRSQQAVEQQRQQQDLYEVMHSVAKYYRHQLRDHPQAEKAKAYLKQRGLSAEIAKAFVIGYAPDGWQNLQPALKADATLTQQLIESGMLIKNEEGRVYDRFRDRIMFPIRDIRGRVIAFGGRILGEGQPKYLNSPETPIFHKSYTLYGLYEMKQSRQNFDHIIVVEGYMDVVSLAQFGVRNAVATLGTATTAEHLVLLFRQVNEVVFCFDGDEAGIKAAWKALELCLPLMGEQRSVKFLFLPQGEDPDSAVRKEGLEGFRSRVKSALSLSQFLIEGLQNQLKAPLASAEGRQHLVALAAPFVQKAHGLYQFLLAEAVAEQVQLPTWRVEKEMGVRSGFASSNALNFGQKKAQSSQNAQSRQERATIKVVPLPLKLIRLLLKRPHWVKVFYPGFAQDVAHLGEGDFSLLANVIHLLTKYEGKVEPVMQWLQRSQSAERMQLIQRSELPDEDVFLQDEFDALMKRLAKKMAAQQVKQAGWDKLALQNLQQLLESR